MMSDNNFQKYLRRKLFPNESYDVLPFGLFFANFIFQKILKINSSVKWMVHYTSVIGMPGRINLPLTSPEPLVSFAASGGCYIQAGNGIEFGENVMFAPGVKIISANHDPNNLDKWLSDSPVKIGDNTWIGANAVILPGVEIGKHCIIGAGAVVTHSFPGKSVIGGVPARTIRLLSE